jgi:hypothetical protein
MLTYADSDAEEAKKKKKKTKKDKEEAKVEKEAYIYAYSSVAALLQLSEKEAYLCELLAAASYGICSSLLLSAAA